MKSIDLEPRLKDLKWLLAIVLLVGAFAHIPSDVPTQEFLPRIPESHTLHVEAAPHSELTFALELYEQSRQQLSHINVAPRFYSLADVQSFIDTFQQSLLERNIIQKKVGVKSLEVLHPYETITGMLGMVNCEKDFRLSGQFTWGLVTAEQQGQFMFMVAHEVMHLATQNCPGEYPLYIPLFSHINESDAQLGGLESLSYTYYTTTSASIKEEMFLGILFGLNDVSRQALLHEIMRTDYCKSRVQQENVRALFGGQPCDMKLLDLLLHEVTIEGYNKYGALPLRFVMDGGTDGIPIERVSRFALFAAGVKTQNGLQSPYLTRFLHDFFPSLVEQR